MTQLTELHCTPLEGSQAMSVADIEAQLTSVPGWRFAEGAITNTYPFKNFHETMAFVNALAWICHVEDHHPDLSVSYSRCTIRFNTHSVGGISINDFICAAKVTALVGREN